MPSHTQSRLPPEGSVSDRVAAVRDFLAALTVDELRDTLLALRGPEASATGKKEALVEQALTAGPIDRVERVATRVEATTPRKHTWLFRLGRSIEDKALTSAAAIKSRVDEVEFRAIDTLDPRSSDLQLRLHLTDHGAGVSYVKFDHWVKTETWRRVDHRHKELVESTARHSVVAVARPRSEVLEVRFDGYTHGYTHDEDRYLPYSEVALSAANKAGEVLGLRCEALSLGTAIERLVDNLPDEVRDVRRSLRTPRGAQLSVAADEGQDGDVAAELATFFGGQAATLTGISRDQVRAALRSATAESVLLLWRQKGLLSRITNHDIGPEILFIWRSAQRSSSSIAYIIDSLLRARLAATAPTSQELLNHVRTRPAGAVVRTSDLAASLGVDSETALNVLERSVRLGLVVRVFRVRTNLFLHDVPNSWRKSLRDFPITVVDENGTTISSDDPHNIEVGYQKCTGSAEMRLVGDGSMHCDGMMR